MVCCKFSLFSACKLVFDPLPAMRRSYSLQQFNTIKCNACQSEAM
uniref:Uncharacterized protein n=1 Tax=Arundo donax TaxID=35708 RepID=A0A0A9ATT3_ARUDO